MFILVFKLTVSILLALLPTVMHTTYGQRVKIT